MKLVITGGHHSSAMPVIEEIRKRDPNVEIFWFGHKYSQKGNRAETLEYKEISNMGIPFYELKAGKFYKTYDPFRLVKIPFGFVQAFIYLLKINPDIILSFGGYLAVPVVLAGWLLGIPSVTHEQTVVVGYANKVISKVAKKILISWEKSRKFFNTDKVVFTGLPLREQIFKQESNNFIINEKLPTIYITAGKTGSHIINTWVDKVFEELLSVCNVIHQCGDHSKYRDYNQLKSAYDKLASKRNLGSYNLRKFVTQEEIGEAFGKADLVIARAGAHTVYELLALGKPCVLIPIPWVSHNEQNENAKILENCGLAKVLNQDQLDAHGFFTEIKETLKNISRYSIEDKSVSKMIKLNSARLISDEVHKTVKKQKKA